MFLRSSRLSVYLFPAVLGACFAGTAVAQEPLPGDLATPPPAGTGVLPPGAPGVGETFVTLIAEEEDIRSVAAKIARRAGVNIQVDRNVEAIVSVRLVNLPWRLVLEAVARDAGIEIEERGPRLLYLTQPPRVTMEFIDADLRLVLDQLARLASKNIVLSPVIGERKVTLTLRNVHWYRALETIVRTVGLVAVREEGDIVRIVRPEDLVAQLDRKTYHLSYLRPPDDYKATAIGSTQGSAGAAGAGGAAAGGRSSGGGSFFLTGQRPPNPDEFPLLKALQAIVNTKIGESVTYDPESNSLLVAATSKTHAEIEDLLKKVDREPQQVFIDVKFISTRNTNFWRDGLKVGVAGRRTGDPNGAGVNVQLLNSSPTNPGLGQFPFIFGEGIDAFSRAFAVPSILDFSQTSLLLQYVEIDSNSKVTQAPTLTTLNDREAVIFVGENVPFAEQTATQDQNGNVTVTLKEGARSPVSVGFTLFITPHIVRDSDQILLTIIPRVSRLTGSQSTGLERFSFTDPVTGITTFIDLPRIADQVVVTKLLIRDGNTAVIGGLMQETVTEIQERIPVLSALPLIGNLFTFDSKDYAQENLIIFVTPRIVRNADDASSLFGRQYQIHQENDWFYLKYLKEREEKEEHKARGTKPAKAGGSEAGSTGEATTPPPAGLGAEPPPASGTAPATGEGGTPR